MKVKAVEVSEECGYVTKGKVYDVKDSPTSGLGFVVDDDGDYILIYFSGEGECTHGVKWEIVE